MQQPIRRQNAALIKWLRALAIAAIAWGGMAAMQANPWWLPALVGIITGAIALGNAELGVLFALMGLCVPILAVSPVLGIVLAVIFFAAEHYLGAGGSTRFLLVGLAVFGAAFGPVWAAAALAGYLLGAAEGALAAAVACVVVEAIGLFTARAAIGSVMSGGSAPAVASFANAPLTLLSSGWISTSFKGLSTAGVNQFFRAFTHVMSPWALLVQIGVWILAAVVAGIVIQRAGRRPAIWIPFAAVTGGVAVGWAGDAVLRIGMGFGVNAGTSAVALGSSLVVALAVVAARETIFAPVVVPATAVAASAVSLAAEDADVDELLRLIATAEDKLAAQHTSERVVLITDMKSFSRMTEEDGSMATAKAIQRHRDLLVPIISANNGCGKSTGGDGVVASFQSAADAIRAAIEGQQALHAHNAAHSNEREIWVRMGLAAGEVVLDNGGRPFIGAGLNLAARVMNLADGGQIFATSNVIAEGEPAGATTYSFGDFELKNISAPVGIGEVLWAQGQLPRDPRNTETPT